MKTKVEIFIYSEELEGSVAVEINGLFISSIIKDISLIRDMRYYPNDSDRRVLSTISLIREVLKNNFIGTGEEKESYVGGLDVRAEVGLFDTNYYVTTKEKEYEEFDESED
jgi:hypothetical protein